MPALYTKTKGKQVSKHLFRVSDPDLGAGWLASRHYSHNREESDWRKPILPPGEKLLFVTEWADAVAGFVKQRFRLDDQRGVYLSIFRNEGAVRSSELLLQSQQLISQRWPGASLFTFVDPIEVESQNPGYCFLCAGWRKVGKTKSGLLIFTLTPEHEPEPTP